MNRATGDIAPRWHAFVPLLRLRLLPSAAADVLAGLALALAMFESALLRAPAALPLVLALFASALLYAGGMVWNDVADVERDRALGRSDKPLVSGRVRRAHAAALAAAMHGLALALLFALGAFWQGLVLVVLILLYDFVGTRQPALGMLLLPTCRVLNVALGFVVVAPDWFLQGETLHADAVVLPLAAYALYVAAAVVHGRLEDSAVPRPRRSTALLVAALLLPLAASLWLPSPWLAAAAWLGLLSGFAAHLWAERRQGRVAMPARTGVLLRGLSRCTTILAFGAGQLVLGAACAVLAYGVPLLLRRIATARWT